MGNILLSLIIFIAIWALIAILENGPKSNEVGIAVKDLIRSFEELITNINRLFQSLIKDLFQSEHSPAKTRKKVTKKQDLKISVVNENNYAELIKELYSDKKRG